MTEAEWLAATDPRPMLRFLDRRASERKLRLVACALIRYAPFAIDGQSMWQLAPGYAWFERGYWRYEYGPQGDVVQTNEVLTMNCHDVVEIAEQFADAPDTAQRLASAHGAAGYARYSAEADTFGYDPATAPGSEFRYRLAQSFEVATGPASGLAPWIIPRVEHLDQPTSPNYLSTATLLTHDVFGNPFCPITFDQSLRTEAVVGLARGMYESRDFGPMPVLADALEDAGCADADILAHCRGPGPHVCGCWVVDLVLGKS